MKNRKNIQGLLTSVFGIFRREKKTTHSPPLSQRIIIQQMARQATNDFSKYRGVPNLGACPN